MTQNAPITLVPDAIHNPHEPRHFMKLVPVRRRVRIWHGSYLLAESTNACRMIEIGRDIYDPVIYFPRQDIKIALGHHELTTHCPLKGDASYFDLLDDKDRVIVAKGAWTYANPIEPAAAISGLVAFYPDGLRIEEGEA